MPPGLVPPETYVNKAGYFEPDWQESFWGGNYPRLREIEQKYDPANLFRVHHGVGSETPGPLSSSLLFHLILIGPRRSPGTFVIVVD